jgi:hypothetical protein
MEALVVIALMYVAYRTGHNVAIRRIGWGNMKGGWRRYRNGRL